ncbi:MAG: zinc-binding dehydrogenase [Anaerolineae bacterium]|nr:zinc-binding dehydrogenase [Anaerolineae bacterium]
MLEPLGVALHAVDLARLRTGMTVGVYGCGPIGLLVLQAARLAGATRIIATDRLPHRVRAARALGAEVAFLSRGGDENPGILTAAGGRGVDVAFECAGENDAVETAVETTGRGGAVLLAGIPAGDRIAFTASSARRKGLTLKLVRRMKHTYPRAIDLAARGLVDVRSLVTDTLPLDAYAEAFATARRREGVKVMIGEE